MWKFTGNRRPDFAVEPGPGQESVWDYPRPPICKQDNREVVVRLGETLITRSSSCVRVMETASPPTFYIPLSDVEANLLQRSPGSSFCEWKGAATYWSVITEDQLLMNVGWSYESPSARFSDIAGHLSFYPSMLDCRVDREAVLPQPGGFYGGWITSEVVGPFKGEAGTSGW